jgi:hypothetical protein
VAQTLATTRHRSRHEKNYKFFSFQCNLLPLWIELFMKVAKRALAAGRKNHLKPEDFSKKHLQNGVTLGILKTELFHIVSCVPSGISNLTNEQKN